METVYFLQLLEMLMQQFIQPTVVLRGPQQQYQILEIQHSTNGLT